MNSLQIYIEVIGAAAIRPIFGLGRYLNFVAGSLLRLVYPPVSWSLLMQQMEFVGIKSLGVVVMAAVMVGAIFGFQLGEIFQIFGAESLIGAAAGFTLSKELAPVVTAMLVTGRAGSSMAAEIATMRVNEQIDAMKVMAVNPLGYLVAPRIAAGIIMTPLLSAVFVLVGVTAAFSIGVMYYDVDVGVFFEKIRWIMKIPHIVDGLQKSAVFGLLLASIGCYSGFYAGRGAKGVGEATTRAVVASMLAVLISDFFVSYLQFRFK